MIRWGLIFSFAAAAAVAFVLLLNGSAVIAGAKLLFFCLLPAYAATLAGQAMDWPPAHKPARRGARPPGMAKAQTRR